MASKLAGNTAKPVLPSVRQSGWRLALTLWHAGGSFRNFAEFALIGAIVLAFLHGLSIDLSVLWRSLAQSTQDVAVQSPAPEKSKLPITPHMDEVMFDESYFASADEPLRAHLIDASRAYAAHNYQRMLDDVASDDPKDRRVLLVRGAAMVKSPEQDTFTDGLQVLVQAGKFGEAKAIAILGVLRLVGFVGYPQDMPRGRALLERAASLGDTSAARVVGMGFLTGWMGTVDPVRAVTMLRSASDRGDVEATFQLARVLNAGLGISKNQSEAEKLMLKAAEAGHLDAQMMLGVWKLRAYSAGVTGDPEQALSWLRRASERGQNDATYTLGIFYLLSKPTTGYHDPKRGADLLRQCAEATLSAQGTFAYATALQEGMGVPLDRVQAYAFYELSDNVQSTPSSRQRLKDLMSMLSHDDIARGDALAAKLRQDSRRGQTPR